MQLLRMVSRAEHLSEYSLAVRLRVPASALPQLLVATSFVTKEQRLDRQYKARRCGTGWVPADATVREARVYLDLPTAYGFNHSCLPALTCVFRRIGLTHNRWLRTFTFLGCIYSIVSKVELHRGRQSMSDSKGGRKPPRWRTPEPGRKRERRENAEVKMEALSEHRITARDTNICRLRNALKLRVRSLFHAVAAV